MAVDRGGLKQRIEALNRFINDVYHNQEIIQAGIVPREILAKAKSYRAQCQGLKPPHGIWCHITGTDLIRHSDGKIYVLEDNLRCPSGVSYVLQNRMVMKSSFPQAFKDSQVRQWTVTQAACTTRSRTSPTPDSDHRRHDAGHLYSAYYEHAFLAQQMGVELVEGRDLVVKDGFVHMRTTEGFQRVDVIYRRIDDDFIDPLSFRADSMLGVRA